MMEILLRGGARVAAWGAGLLVAGWIVPGVVLRAPGFLLAWLFFSVVMGVLSLFILRLPHGYASLGMGSAALVMTFASLGLGAAIPNGLGIPTPPAWLATGVVVWLVTTISATLVPDVYIRKTRSPEPTESVRK